MTDAAIYNIRYPRARRARRCDECLDEIEAGWQYRSDSQLYEGQWHTSSMCISCDVVARQWCHDMEFESWPIGDLYGEITGNLSEAERTPEMAAGITRRRANCEASNKTD